MATKKELLQQAVAKAVGAGKPVALETVDFNDPNRPKTCLEVDFPILPVNQVAIIEGNAGKPIYQMSKWWARRRSSVFRSMLIAAATKAMGVFSLSLRMMSGFVGGCCWIARGNSSACRLRGRALRWCR